MATVNTTSILGSDSISASRTTINSNFLLLENWINGYVSTFGIDTINGILNLSQATTGSVYAKTGYFDQIQVPANGTFTARILSIHSFPYMAVLHGQADIAQIRRAVHRGAGRIMIDRGVER